ncbi:hypothetical protein SFC65_06905 [Priestia filamentosa]|nr:hypothetical protein [Priestia filamentosa]WRU93945.1 hypothetical protein RYX51_12980 [Priestia filamentosa]SMF17170.1 hypothetical protein SAMN06296056_1011367 [Priestia filamentosa]
MWFDSLIDNIETCGALAPGNIVYEKFGFTVENVIAKYKELI